MFNDQNRQLFSANYLVFNGLLWSDPNRIIVGPAREAGFNIDKLEDAWAKFEAART
jgi:hypothetical protein